MSDFFNFKCVTFIFVSLFVGGYCGCHKENWLISFDSEGVSKCGSSSDNINGFYRSRDDYGIPDQLRLVEEANCCTRDSVYGNDGSLVINADWWDSFDRDNQWNSCPNGFFLNGLYRNGGRGGLWLIEEGRCSKPSSHPYHYGHCYDQDVLISFDHRGDSNCQADYFITGLYRGGCGQLFCLEKFRCCKMASGPSVLDSLAEVKTRIMDKTLEDISLLANYLGYGWCSGCMALYVGEDFRRNGDTWEADKSRRCNGYKSDHRLSVNYADWGFEIKDIRFGQPVIQDLTPETVDSGTETNNDPHPSTKTITRQEQAVRTVTHTTTSAWKMSHELGVEITYTPPSATGGVGGGASYKFGFETSSTTSDSTQNQQVNTFTVTESKTLGPYTAVNWSLVLSKTRVTIPYTATIIVRFSTELRGFLRWGGGRGNPNTNYHYQHRGSGDRPTVHYRFGNANVPFYKALKRESQTGSHPWLWSDMMNAHGDAQNVINRLTNEGQYEFTLTGKFDDVSGKHVSFRWDATTPLPPGRYRRSSASVTEEPSTDHTGMKVLKTIAKERAGDPPPVFPDPPKVVLDKGPLYDLVKIPVDNLEE